MRFTAHSLRSFVPVLALAVLAALASNSASAQQHRLNVPFNFVANGQDCPAGTYTVNTNNWGSVVVLHGAGRNFTWLIGPGEPAPTDSRVLLKFDHQGSSYALRAVQVKSQTTGRLDRKFRERIPAAQQVAMLSQITIVAGQE